MSIRLFAISLFVVLAPLVAQVEKPAGNPPTLVPETPVVGEIAGSGKHTYIVTLAAGEVAAVSIEQRGIDLLGRFLSVDGKVIVEFDSESRLNGTERAELVADSSGNYKLDIEARYKGSPPGQYSVTLTAVRPATDRDRLSQKARQLHAEANRLASSGNYAQARTTLEEALQIRETTLGLDNADAARTLMLMGNISYFVGDYPKAESIFLRTSEIFEKDPGPDSPLLAISLNNLASLYMATGNFVKSEALHQRALAIRKKSLPPDHPDIAQSLNNLANVYNAKGDSAGAEPLYSQALQINERILGADHINLASPLSNLATVYRNLHNYEKADELFRRSLKIRQQTLGPDHPDVAGVLNRLGLLYSDKKDYVAAEEFLQKALAIYEKQVARNPSQIATALDNIGLVSYLRNDLNTAESYYRRALAIKADLLGLEHPETVGAMGRMVRLFMARADYGQALSLQSQAIAGMERTIGFNLTTGSERQKLAYLAGLSLQFDQTISLHARYIPDDREALRLAVSLVLDRKGRVLDAVSDSFTALRRRANEQDRDLLNKLSAVTSSLAKLVLDGPQKRTPEQHQSQIKVLEEQREALESEAARRSSGFYEQSNRLTVSEVQSAIPTDAALVELAVYRPVVPLPQGPSPGARYIAYVIVPGGDLGWADLGEAKTIDDLVRDFRRALRDPKMADIQKVAREADERIMRPVRALIGRATHLFISADGSLNLIPFEAMVDPQGKYLIESYAFTYLTSGRDLLRLRVARPASSEPLAFAAPLFDGPRARRSTAASAARRLTARSETDLSSVYFTPLDGTSQEVRAIQSLFPETKIFEREQATESALKDVAAPRILHIATHGFFLRDSKTNTAPDVTDVDDTRSIDATTRIDNPLLRSGLALTGANLHTDGPDDGILTALEASGLNLWGTKLVTLSACDTGVGEVVNGEGVYGLRRAMVLAGAEALVMSLWPVSDLVTREMMISYYTGLKQGLGRGEALRHVQLEMLRKKGRQHPFYWASFIHSGAWSPLDGN